MWLFLESTASMSVSSIHTSRAKSNLERGYSSSVNHCFLTFVDLPQYRGLYRLSSFWSRCTFLRLRSWDTRLTWKSGSWKSGAALTKGWMIWLIFRFVGCEVFCSFFFFFLFCFVISLLLRSLQFFVIVRLLCLLVIYIYCCVWGWILASSSFEDEKKKKTLFFTCLPSILYPLHHCWSAEGRNEVIHDLEWLHGCFLLHKCRAFPPPALLVTRPQFSHSCIDWLLFATQMLGCR